MDNPEVLSIYDQQVSIFRRVDCDRDRMIQDLLGKYNQLQQGYKKVCDDLSNEVESRRMWQTKANNLGKELASLTKAHESSPFIYAIIDGDGAIFQEALLEKGAEGGAEAGYLLSSEIKTQITNAHPNAAIEDWSIIVQVVLNIDGLARRLHASHIIPNTPTERILAEFGRGFGRAQPLFSFIDVGSGKESADHKIREMLRVMVRVNQCRHIFFAPCHDNGYLPVLQPYNLDHRVVGKLTLIETTPAEVGFKRLNFPIISFKSVFMSEKLPERVHRPAIGGIPSTLAVPTAVPVQPLASVTGTDSNNNDVPPRSTANKPPRVSSPRLSHPQTPNQWSAVGKASSAPKKVDVSNTNKAQTLKYYLLNQDSQRVDEPLPNTHHAVEKNSRGRVTTAEKLCNNYHLRNDCKNPWCPYVHGEKLSPGELLLLKQRCRGIPCSTGSICSDFSCIFGHGCMWTCNANNCRFKSYHGINKEPRVRVFEDGSSEIFRKL
ncbi:hypothetical protein CDEST_01859 [Colletotrichum destructivum]|uniref:C-x8-C-x5-C-x3-H type zinc finger protein n=1 Tax=Colletotrichum destructivum TaxID=34406 RepID=A0AAX4I1J7_9PEZI|nr:hypothetical protein CDEST_01859 [Colletotrichum destructivum]